MIQIAIVAPAITRHSGNKSGTDYRKGSFWTLRKRGPRRRTLQSTTAKGCKLELSAFLERYKGRSIGVQVICPLHADRAVAAAVLELLPSTKIHDVPHAYTKFIGKRKSNEPTIFRFHPFEYGFESTAFPNFQPHWYVAPEPQNLLKSLSGDFYTYPSTTDDEGENDVTEESESNELHV